MAHEIRTLKEADASAWREVRLRMLREHPEAFGADAEEFASQELDFTVERIRSNSGPDSFMYGAFEGGVLVGTIGFYRPGGPKRRHLVEIWGMYVVPESRRRGCGRDLVGRALEDIRQVSGVRHVRLGVAMSNREARALYDSFGFEPYGVEPAGLRIGEQDEDIELRSLPL